jgi:two-component system CheB/CheR fusion protein
MPDDDRRQSLEDLLVFVKESRGFDFTGYKRSSIERRVTKRMAEVGAERYDDYIDYLQLHADEFAQLFNTLLINVTGFFRDLQTWEYMAEEIVPQLVASRLPDTPLRVWSAGCASGEEAYTVAMVFARVLGDEAFRTRVKIYATDVDEEALDYARLGAYLPRQIEDVPREALDRFFERTEQRYVFRKDLRRCVIFGRNDLVQDAPISRIDLLVCRNTLMYFTADTQAQMLRRFHFALDDVGVLLLGKSEMLITHANLFTPVDLKRRVFKKVIKPALPDRLRLLTSEPGNGAGQSTADNLREGAFDIGGGAQIVLDVEGTLMMTNAVARRTFGLGVSDLGRPVQDLELSYRPLELRSHLELVISSRHATEVRAVPWRSRDRDRLFDVQMVPVVADGLVLGTSINYVDVTEPHRLQDAVATSKRELEQAYEELQATVEELETTNEELQSTNEELETTNEELQSSNEELETMNDELRHRTLELNEVNGFLETVLTTIGSAVAVIDRNQHVQIWSRQARELWGLMPEEVEDQHLLSLDFGLPVERVRSQLRAALSGASEREEVVLAAVNRRGQAFDCRVTMLPLGASEDENGSGVIMMMEPVESSEPAESPERLESPEPVSD